MKFRLDNNQLVPWIGTKDRNVNRHKEVRDRKDAFHNASFIAIDGEGINPKKPSRVGEQWYAYLAASSGEFLKKTVRGGIPTLDVFEFLTNLSKEHPGSTFVIFAGGYDMNMWLKDVSRETLKKIYDGESTDWQGYSIKYIPRKSMTISKFAPRKWGKDKKGKYKPNYTSQITIWDVWGFFSTSFVNAITEYKIVTEEEKILIEAGKKGRHSFTKEALERDIIPYCQLELELLVRLMKKLHEYLEKAQLPVTRWDGAGAIAGALLKREKIKEYLGRDTTPDMIERIAAYAFSGGRIECLKYGHTAKKVYNYDLNSAYPAMAQDLPSLVGLWELAKDFHPFDYSAKDIVIVDLSWKLAPEPFYPFFVRDATKGICYPQEGRNKMYLCELLAYIKTHRDTWRKHIIIHSAFVFIPDHDKKPFSFIPKLYTLRKIWKSQGEGAERVLKLGINSVYGKLVQQKGYLKNDAEEKKDPRPPYFALPYAGMITAQTRAALYEAGMQKPYAIICFATDGIYSEEELNLSCSNTLGAWEYTEVDNMTIVQSGVYWYEQQGKLSSYYRGFDPDTLTRTMLLEAWNVGSDKVIGVTTRYITMGTALVTEERFNTLWRTWHTDSRSLELHPDGKRIAISRTGNPSLSLQETTAQQNPNTLIHTFHVKHGFSEEALSVPYTLPWELSRIETPEELEVVMELLESMA